MTEIARRILTPPAGYAATEAGLFVEQLDDQDRRLREDIQTMSAAELAWQPEPGLNSAVMLLAHIAIVEVHWIQIGPLAMADSDVAPVLGIGVDDDGMPLAAGGLPPSTLRDRDLGFYVDLQARARAHTKRSLASIGTADLDREITRRHPDGTPRAVINARWVLYHLVEHEAGHRGQILLLRHQHRIATGAA